MNWILLIWVGIIAAWAILSLLVGFTIQVDKRHTRQQDFTDFVTDDDGSLLSIERLVEVWWTQFWPGGRRAQMPEQSFVAHLLKELEVAKAKLDKEVQRQAVDELEMMSLKEAKKAKKKQNVGAKLLSGVEEGMMGGAFGGLAAIGISRDDLKEDTPEIIEAEEALKELTTKLVTVLLDLRASGAKQRCEELEAGLKSEQALRKKQESLDLEALEARAKAEHVFTPIPPSALDPSGETSPDDRKRRQSVAGSAMVSSDEQTKEAADADEGAGIRPPGSAQKELVQKLMEQREKVRYTNDDKYTLLMRSYDEILNRGSARNLLACEREVKRLAEYTKDLKRTAKHAHKIDEHKNMPKCEDPNVTTAFEVLEESKLAAAEAWRRGEWESSRSHQCSTL